jgi:hypothetical protein
VQFGPCNPPLPACACGTIGSTATVAITRPNAASTANIMNVVFALIIAYCSREIYNYISHMQNANGKMVMINDFIDSGRWGNKGDNNYLI